MSSRILVVEPDVSTREAIVAALERSVWVVGVGTAREALAQLRSGAFDVVLTEIALGAGEPSGTHLLAEVARRCPWMRRIAMSTSADAQRRSDEPVLLKPLGALQLAVIAGVEEEYAAA